MPRRRIDTLLAERGLAGSRTSAAASVRAGRVRIGPDGPFASKPSQLVADDAELLVTEPPRFVSRGGIKLENALEA
ncbi:MAG: S4 domain-containing protein, partial [Solirubrobacterales bacterium]